jgi:hypothetical protein
MTVHNGRKNHVKYHNMKRICLSILLAMSLLTRGQSQTVTLDQPGSRFGTITGGAVSVANGGTGATSASNAFNAIAPSKTGNGGKFLRINAGATDWEVATLSGGGDAVTSGALSQFASTTSDQLRGIISNPTGTGSLVFATDAALAGTPTAPTATAGTSTIQIATTAFVQSGGPLQVLGLGSNATANATTSMVEITGLNKTVGTGTYHFKYIIRAQSSAATTSLKFAVNHTGTTTVFTYNLFFPSAGVTASTGVADQEVNTTTGQVWAFEGTRVKNTTLGPHTDVDVINADVMYVIEGMCTVTVSGDLELYHGSETAASTQVMAGSALILTKLL